MIPTLSDLQIVADFLLPLGVPVLLYFVLQTAALLRPRIRGSALTLLPLVAMSIAIVSGVQAYHRDSNLWPIWMIFVSLPACVFLMLALLSNRAAEAAAALADKSGGNVESRDEPEQP